MYAAGPGKTIVDQLFYGITLDVTYTIQGSGAAGAETITLNAADGSSLYEIITYAGNTYGDVSLASITQAAADFDAIHGVGYSEGQLIGAIQGSNST